MATKSQTPPRRWARTPETILAALGCVPSREMKLKLRVWRTYPGFPKKQRNGIDIDELKAWVDANSVEFLKDAKRAKILQDGESFSGADLKLFSAGSRTVRHVAPGLAEEEFPEIAHGMDELGALIMRRFKDYPTLGEVGRQRIHAWKSLRGVAKRPGLVPFPAPTSRNDYKTVEAFDWVARWIIPDLSRNQGDLLGDNTDWTNALRKIEFENKQIEQAQLKGRLMDKAEHNRILAGLGRLGRDDLWLRFDQLAYARLPELLAAEGVPEEWTLAAVRVVRRLNPQLLVEHHQHLEELIKGAEQVIPAAEGPAGKVETEEKET